MSKFASLALPVDELTSRVEISDLSGAPLLDADGQQSYVEVRHPDCSAMTDLARKVGNRILARRGPTRRMMHDLESEELEKLVALTVGWHIVALNGEVVDEPFSAAAAKELYSLEGWKWLRRQVEAHLSDQANFTQPLSRN